MIHTSHFFVTMYFNFIVYSFLGWIVQGIFVGFKHHRFMNTGFLYGPYVPIYGFGALIVLYILLPVSSNVFFLFFGAMLLTSVLEYFTSWALQKLFHKQWWNYSKRPFNLHGRICLLNSSLYGAAAVFITYVSEPLIDQLMAHFSWPGIEIFEGIFSVVFFTDLAFTLHHMLEERKVLHKIHQKVQQAAATHAAMLSAEHDLISSSFEQAREKGKQSFLAHQKELEDLYASYAKVRQHRLARIYPHAVLNDEYQQSVEKAKKLLEDVHKTVSRKVQDLQEDRNASEK